MSRLTTLYSVPIYCRIFEPYPQAYVCKGCHWDKQECTFPLKKPRYDLKKIIEELPCLE